MSGYDFDLFVIGGGSGGVRAARLAANLGYGVGLAEESRMGGTCVIRGCIPKKLFVYASRFADEFELAPSFGWTVGEPRFDWPTLRANKDKEIARLEGLYTKAVENAGGTVFHERVVLLDAHRLKLASGRQITADKILIATGGYALRAVEGVPGLEHCITSNEAFDLERLPRRVVVAGGGYIAVEFAHIFHGLGVDTTLIYRGPKVLRGFDEDLRDALHASMARRGLHVLTHDVFTAIERGTDGLVGYGEHIETVSEECFFQFGDLLQLRFNDQHTYRLREFSCSRRRRVPANGVIVYVGSQVRVPSQAVQAFRFFSQE